MPNDPPWVSDAADPAVQCAGQAAAPRPSRAFWRAGGLCDWRGGVIERFDAICNHFDVSRMAQAGALASLADTEHVAWVVGEVKAARERIAAIAAANGLKALPSATNFIAIDFGRDGAFAKSVLDGLIARGIFVRMPGVAPLNRCIRVSAGTPADLDAFEAALEDVVRAVSGTQHGSRPAPG